ncbi:hypothetical protein [Rhizobium sp. HT1-10]|uniref:hypothetical protein n=1 Tax=Rhizobium sp. HT1-10 TaxID=3111638 RepID=UPI003C1BA7F6
MKVHSSQSSYSAPLLSQSYSDSDDDTPFVLPDDEDSSQKKAAPSISSAGISNSISSGFWLNQSGGAGDSTASTSGTSSSNTAASDDDILSEFAKWANMSPAEKIRAQYLEQQNMTEEQFSQLPADQQKAINDQIADMIKQQLGDGKTGDADGDSDGGSTAVSLG